uniref:Uncharacterized protein n=1 Tax=Palpitomonas bilix TaxID=652834 RepID=A0A7S3D2G3_9EUKA
MIKSRILPLIRSHCGLERVKSPNVLRYAASSSRQYATSSTSASTSQSSSSVPSTSAGRHSGGRRLPDDGMSLKDFIPTSSLASDVGGVGAEVRPYGSDSDAFDSAAKPPARNVMIETYGCQMNVSDSEIVRAILLKAGYNMVDNEREADVILINTCAIRDNAEQKVWNRLENLKHVRLQATRKMLGRHVAADEVATMKTELPRRSTGLAMVGVLGCMAERLKRRLVESDKLVDVVVGPDAYRDLPRLIAAVGQGEAEAVNTMLSLEETYADINPVRVSDDGVPSAYVSIMRGCNNYCAYCIVPLTRGRERSRDPESITDEAKRLAEQGVKEIVLLGQNVNSYCYRGEGDFTSSKMSGEEQLLSRGFQAKIQPREGGFRFVDLVDSVSAAVPDVRIRYTSPHPKDFPDPLLDLVRERPNVCKSMHMPAQSGSTRMLEAMRRGYTREAYIELAERIRERVPGISISTDMISGFCGETEEDHADTLSLMKHMKYEQAFMFAYSMRERTLAHKKMVDDVPHDVKIRRLNDVISCYHDGLRQRNREEAGRHHLVLIEGRSKRSENEWTGRTDTNRKVVFPKQAVASTLAGDASAKVDLQVGDFVLVQIESDTLTTLRGTALARTTIPEHARFLSVASNSFPSLSL